MVPIALMAGATIGSALLQWYNSNQAANATAAERAKVEELLGKIQQPGFDVSKITPEDFQVVAKFTPEQIPTIAEANPTLVKAMGAGAQQGSAAQKSMLEKMLMQAESGTDPLYELAQRQAARQAAGTAASNRASLSDQFARRGAMNSGLQFAGNQAAIGNEQTAQALAGEQAAANQFQRQQQAQQNAANLGGQMYGQDVNMEQLNANIMNQFNQRAVENANRANQFNAQQRQAASNANQQVGQDIANKNVGQRNAAAYDARDTANKYNQQTYQNSLDKARILAGQSEGRTQDINANTNQQNQALAGLAGGLTNIGMYAGKPEAGPQSYDEWTKARTQEKAGENDPDYVNYKKGFK